RRDEPGTGLLLRRGQVDGARGRRAAAHHAPVVEPEDADDEVGDLARHVHLADPTAVLALGVRVADEVHPEYVLDRVRGTLDLDRARARVLVDHVEPGPLHGVADLRDVGRIGAVLFREILARERRLRTGRDLRQRRAPPDLERETNPLRRIDGP